MNSLVLKIVNGFLKSSDIYRIKRLRSLFWNIRANDIDRKWGSSNGDYETVRKIIEHTKAKRILDFGCGSGRLFPLFESLKIKEVVGLDISNKAVDLAKQKYPKTNYRLICGDVQKLDYQKKYFDLIISNRSLSAIPPKNLPSIINRLCSLGKYIYLNEFGDPENVAESFYWFKHDYKIHLENNNFILIEKGVINESSQRWFLFGDNSK